jgi:CysZ protein
MTLLVGYAGDLYGWATQWMPLLEAGAWYTWLWIGPAKAGLTLLGAVLFAALAAVCLLSAFLLANVLASPFLDALSARVEVIVAGEVSEQGEAGWLGSATDMLRSVREELKRTLFFVSVVAALSAVGLVIPGAQLLTGPAIVAFAIFFLPLDYSSYTLDRQRLSFGDKRVWLSAHKPVVCGFGAAAFLICAVPGLNFVAMPILVIGGTLLALRTRSGD